MPAVHLSEPRWLDPTLCPETCPAVAFAVTVLVAVIQALTSCCHSTHPRCGCPRATAGGHGTFTACLPLLSSDLPGCSVRPALHCPPPVTSVLLFLSPLPLLCPAVHSSLRSILGHYPPGLLVTAQVTAWSHSPQPATPVPPSHFTADPGGLHSA